MKYKKTIVICSILAILGGCGKAKEISSENKTKETPSAVSQKEIDPKITDAKNEAPTNTIESLTEEDKQLLKHYGTCAIILKASIHYMNTLKEKDLVSVSNHQATIYQILTTLIIQKYPASLQDEAYKIGNQFLEAEILGKSLTGQQLNAFKKQNGDCFLEEISRARIDEIMTDYKPSYEKIYNNNKNL